MTDERQTRILARLEQASLGVPLSRLVARPATPDVLRAFAKACRLVDRAHACGIVHRNLQPSNIVVGEGEVHVRGWEHARLDDEDEATLPHVTSQYAPLDGRRDARSDIYSLGCILFELLAGSPLHAQAGALDAAQRSPSSRSDRAIAVPLDALCVAATAPEPAHRVQTARELADRVLAIVDAAPSSLDVRSVARTALPIYVLYILFVPGFLWFASGERFFAVALTSLVSATAGLLFLQGRGARWRPWLFAALNVSLVVLTCRIASLMCAPTIAAITIAGMAFGPTYVRGRYLALLAAAMSLAILGVFVAERAGWLSPTLTMITDGYAIVAPVFHLRPAGLIAGFVGYVLTVILASGALVHALLRRERRRVTSAT